MVDDNARWQEYLDYRERHADVHARPIDVRERILIAVADEQSIPVHDAHVEVLQGDRLVFAGRTDTAGRLLFHPRAMTSGQWQVDSRQAQPYQVVVAKGQAEAHQIFDRQAGNQWALTLESPPAMAETQLDLLFLIDATGSMGDEIDKLKASMADMADEIARLPEQPDVRYGLVAYRDLGTPMWCRPVTSRRIWALSTHSFGPARRRRRRRARIAQRSAEHGRTRHELAL